MKTFILLILLLWCNVETARILTAFSAPSLSHQAVFKMYVEDLVLKGHKVTVITPNPEMFDADIKNIKILNVSVSALHMRKLFEDFSSDGERGVIKSIEKMIKHDVWKKFLLIISAQFKTPQVRKLMFDSKEKFDLIVIEAISNYALVLSHIFNAPAILLSSSYGYHQNLQAMGAVGWHPIYYPMVRRTAFGSLTITKKIYQIYLEFLILKNGFDVENEENRLLKSDFGTEVPSVDELKNNIALLFVNTHPLFDNNRPVPPGVVYLGALHLKPVETLPEETQSILDQSKHGVIYVSLGTNVDPSQMDEELLNIFTSAFKSLPYTVLWKFNGVISEPPDNLITRIWFPQRDLLCHDKVLAFVTQGGLQSTDESISAGTPLVGIPFLSDQWYNTYQYQRLGIGLALDPYSVTADQLASTIIEVVNNGSYRENIEKLRDLINDQPQSARERAVWWTEFVLRQGPATRTVLRASGAQVSWSEYLMVDLCLLITIIIMTTLAVFCFTCYFVCRLCPKSEIKIKEC